MPVGLSVIPLLGPGVREEQRGDHRVELRLVVLPLVHAALPDLQPGVQTGDVRGRGGGKLRRELCHAARSRETTQGRIIVRHLLEEAPAEAVQQDQHDGAEGARPARKESVRQRGNAGRAEQRPDAGRHGGEAVLIVGWTNERGIECEHGLFSGADDSAETTQRQTAVPPTSSPSPNALYFTPKPVYPEKKHETFAVVTSWRCP